MDMYSAGGVTVTDFRRRPYTEFLYKHLEGVNQQLETPRFSFPTNLNRQVTADYTVMRIRVEAVINNNFIPMDM
jgi:hypothetical protein